MLVHPVKCVEQLAIGSISVSFQVLVVPNFPDDAKFDVLVSRLGRLRFRWSGPRPNYCCSFDTPRLGMVNGPTSSREVRVFGVNDQNLVILLTTPDHALSYSKYVISG